MNSVDLRIESIRAATHAEVIEVRSEDHDAGLLRRRTRVDHADDIRGRGAHHPDGHRLRAGPGAGRDGHHGDDGGALRRARHGLG